MKEAYLLIVLFTFYHHATLGQMVGGWSSVEDTNNEKVQKYASFATDRISTASNSVYGMRLVEVIDSQKQVVSGVKYNITMKIGATECKKNQKLADKDISQCEFLSSEAPQICNAVVWDQPWIENSTKLLKFSCKPVKK